jgi:hypothetical protein
MELLLVGGFRKAGSYLFQGCAPRLCCVLSVNLSYYDLNENLTRTDKFLSEIENLLLYSCAKVEGRYE